MKHWCTEEGILVVGIQEFLLNKDKFKFIKNSYVWKYRSHFLLRLLYLRSNFNFLSYGVSSVLISMVSIEIILNI